MSDELRLSKSSALETTIYAKSMDSLGMDLGELRAAVKAAEGLSDESQVRFGELSDSIIHGEHFAKRVTIRERRAAE